MVAVMFATGLLRNKNKVLSRYRVFFFFLVGIEYHQVLEQIELW